MSEPRPLSRAALLATVAAALAGASAITVLFVLPAEMQIDPTGFGRWSGLVRMGDAAMAPAATDSPDETPLSPGTAFYPAAFRSHVVEIRLESSDRGPRARSELEYKVAMKAGGSLVYSLTVEGLSDPEEFYFDFHGEGAPPPGGTRPVIAEYRQATGSESHGVLVAPMTGVHGWFLQNQSAGAITVRLRLSGFYDLVPPGEYGNDAGIAATPVGD